MGNEAKENTQIKSVGDRFRILAQELKDLWAAELFPRSGQQRQTKTWLPAPALVLTPAKARRASRGNSSLGRGEMREIINQVSTVSCAPSNCPLWATLSSSTGLFCKLRENGEPWLSQVRAQRDDAVVWKKRACQDVPIQWLDR